MLEILVTTGELVLSEPATTIRTQWRGMDRLEHKVSLTIDHRSLAAGIAAPQHIDNMFAMGGEGTDGGIGELLPPKARMAIRLVGTDGE